MISVQQNNISRYNLVQNTTRMVNFIIKYLILGQICRNMIFDIIRFIVRKIQNFDLLGDFILFKTIIGIYSAMSLHSHPVWIIKKSILVSGIALRSDIIIFCFISTICRKYFYNWEFLQYQKYIKFVCLFFFCMNFFQNNIWFPLEGIYNNFFLYISRCMTILWLIMYIYFINVCIYIFHLTN